MITFMEDITLKIVICHVTNTWVCENQTSALTYIKSRHGTPVSIFHANEAFCSEQSFHNTARGSFADNNLLGKADRSRQVYFHILCAPCICSFYIIPGYEIVGFASV